MSYRLGRASGRIAGLVLMALMTVICAVAGMAKETGWGIFIAGFACVLTVLGVGPLLGAIHYLRGRWNRDAGISCSQCQRTAFPIAGTTTRYRCWNCGCRFDGPEHF